MDTRRLVVGLLLSSSTAALSLIVVPERAVASPVGAGQAPAAASATGQCLVTAAALDKVTPFRWTLGRYQTNRAFIPSPVVRIDVCELIGNDAGGAMKTAVTVNVARGAQAQAFAKYWRDVCGNSIMPDARGTVQPISGVAGGFQCVAKNPASSTYWLESPAQTVQVEPQNDAAPWAQVMPKLLATIAR